MVSMEGSASNRILVAVIEDTNTMPLVHHLPQLDTPSKRTMLKDLMIDRRGLLLSARLARWLLSADCSTE